MQLQEMIKELSLVFFSYDEINKAFLIKSKSLKNSNTIEEFTRIIETLKDKQVDYEIVNTKCILVKV